MSNELDASRVGVIGSGPVGRRLAAGFAERGHDVAIGTRDPENPDLHAWLDAEGGPRVRAATLAETAASSELLVLATMGTAVIDVLGQIGAEAFAGKVVIDATNPLDFSGGPPPTLFVGHTDSLGERVQRAIPDAKVVKAFNTIGNASFVHPSFAGGTPTMFICGDDEDAKATVAEILADFGWSPPVDIGGIEGARELESLCILWVKIGFGRGAWDHGFALLAG